MEMKYLWLDDFRNPVKWLSVEIREKYEVIWVKSYDEFATWITKNGLPDVVSFDHDLADEHYADYAELTDDPYLPEDQQKTTLDYDSYTEKTGMDCAKLLVDYCYSNRLNLPRWTVHSQNTVGKQNIESYLSNSTKYHLVYDETEKQNNDET